MKVLNKFIIGLLLTIGVFNGVIKSEVVQSNGADNIGIGIFEDKPIPGHH
ncbi:hypothetical protein MKX67_22085 [Cytobacillus sp. FSL W7-1323]|nr:MULTISPECIES: hypothetical protein [Cytobacillus]MDQ0186045.1 hypothetical protein [Cytobacillus kochii]MEA1853784.1 hypothetical protein [Cytobacillus sp. OWB-43]MED1605735.1 hypothetical protein [Cytobacillus kochii]